MTSGGSCGSSSWRQSAGRYEVTWRSKGLKQPESTGVAAAPLAPAAAITGDSVWFLASRLMEYAQLSTWLLAKAKALCNGCERLVGLLARPSC